MDRRPAVIVDPAFRRVDEIFDEATWATLHERFEVLWGRDEPMPTEHLLEALPRADAIVYADWRHGVVALDESPVRAVLEVAGGFEEHGLGLVGLVERGVRVGSCAPSFGRVVAEMALALALAGRRGVVAADRAMRERTERWLHDGNRTNATLVGATVGFVGAGGISVRLQELLEPFRVRILAYDPPAGDAALRARGIEPVELDALLNRADVVFVLAAPTPENRHLLDATRLGRLRSDQLLVLVSRAHLVDFAAMTELVTAGRFAVATDVFPNEPLGSDHPIRDAERAICVPHLAGALPDALLDIGRSVLADLTAIFDGGTPDAMQYLGPDNLAGLLQRRG
ncbi:MAG: NAD(P)-dependent oxidoreductase [Actinomycetota bacterium]